MTAQRAIVLGSRPIREADQIVTLLSEEAGKISAVARNARRSRKRFMGGLDLFDCGRCTLTAPKGNSTLYILEQFSARQSWSSLLKSLESLSLAAFCIELTNLLTAEGDPAGGELFRPLYFSLRALDRATSLDAKLAIDSFYILESLRQSGFDVINELGETATCVWFKRMLADSRPSVPAERQVMEEGLQILLQFAERAVERPLHSATELRRLARA